MAVVAQAVIRHGPLHQLETTFFPSLMAPEIRIELPVVQEGTPSPRSSASTPTCGWMASTRQ